MTTGAAWNTDNPEKPWALWDPDANITIPIGLADWLASLGVSYGSHEVIADAPLQCVDPGTYQSGTVGVRMALANGAIFQEGAKYPITIRVVGTDGETQDDRTLWLKIKSR